MSTVVMPRLSDSMEEGTILRWLVSDGDTVARGDELVEIETDKATSTYEADEAGTLHILAGPGETLAVGAPIARMGEDASEPVDGRGPSPVGGDTHADQPRVPAPRLQPTAVHPGSDRRPRRRSASPVARRIAAEHDVNLQEAVGSGPGGRIVRRDVEALLAAATATPAPEALSLPPQPAAAAGERSDVTVQELSRVQQVIARRMTESRNTVPDFEVRARVDVQSLLDVRLELKRPGVELTPTVNDFVVKAVALALRDVPRANGAYRDGRWELHERVSVGIAVTTDEGLFVPTIVDAGSASVGEIAHRARALAAKAREGTLSPEELSGGTFTVSNLGMFGVTSFSPVIFAPQAGILGVGAAAPTPVVVDGEVVVRAVMELVLACDHRILYGADAARLLARIRELLENPLHILAG